MPRERKIFYGWWMVLAAAFSQFLVGGTFYYGFTVFFNPIRQTFGWTAAVTSVAFTLQRLEFGIMGPIAGYLVDKLGPRRLVIFGWCVIVLGFFLMSRINSLWAFYASFMVIATGMSFASGVVINTAIANWFTKKRSRALALTYLGPGLAGTLAPLLAFLIMQFGWRDTLTYVGIALLVICIPICLLIRNRPSQYGYLPDGETPTAIDEPASVPGIHPSSEITTRPDSSSAAAGMTAREALKTRTFWLLALVAFFMQIGISAVHVHIVPYLESVNVPTTIAAIAVTGMTLCSLIGRLTFGFLGDFTNKRYLLTIALAFQAIGIFVFSFITEDKTWLLFLFLFTFGPGYGGQIPVRPALQGDYFGTRSFGMIMGLTAAVSMLGALASPVIAGWIFDTMGSYNLAWRIFALVTIPAIPLMLLAKPPRIKQENNIT